jgi:hypothetical protein
MKHGKGKLFKGISTAADFDNTPVVISSATVTLSHAEHAGRPIVFSKAGGIVCTLPAATGTGDIYRIIIAATFTGTSTIATSPSTDYLLGTYMNMTGAEGYANASTTNKITNYVSSNTTGGVAGERIDLMDIASGKWAVTISSEAGGTEATPFSHV